MSDRQYWAIATASGLQLGLEHMMPAAGVCAADRWPQGSGDSAAGAGLQGGERARPAAVCGC